MKRDYENRPENGSGPNFGPFHYGSLYSNPGIVLHFLVRLPPFTKLLMEYQVNAKTFLLASRVSSFTLSR